jgi:hypothetical protein
MATAKTWAREWRVILEFFAGFAATIFFHQPVVWIFHALGVSPRAPFDMTPVPPFGIPAVISLAFWGGIWGIIMIPALSRIRSEALWWIAAILFGAIFPTLVAGLIVAPLKHITMPRTAAMALFGLTVNGVWGLGTAIIFRLTARQK